jgi:hypothetical protein
LPDKPLWYSRLPQAITALEKSTEPWVDRTTVEFLLGVGRRRAQQLLQPLVSKTLGRNGLVARGRLLSYFRKLAAGEDIDYETQRRERVRAILTEARAQPRVLVEAPLRVLHQRLAQLPTGVTLSPGRIVVEGFTTADEALQKLLALALAAGNEPEAFAEAVSS